MDWLQVEPCEYKCAKKFLDALDETHDRYRGKTWIYRGQNVDKLLFPTAMRPCKMIDDFVEAWFVTRLEETFSYPNKAKEIDNEIKRRLKSFHERDFDIGLIEHVLAHWSKGESESWKGPLKAIFPQDQLRENYISSTLHAVAEREVVVAFVSLADEVGLRVPQDNFSTTWNRPFPVRDQARDARLRNDDAGLKVGDEYPSIAFALARHHGVPTRLLDFTYRPLIAAFFAADSDCEEDYDLDRRIVVWAIHAESLPEDVQVVKHRRSEIGFLQAQDGLFIYDKRADDRYLGLGEWAPLDNSLLTLAKHERAFKFTLPFSKKGDLLDLLELKGIHRPMLMPSFDFVSREIQKSSFNLMEYMVNRA